MVARAERDGVRDFGDTRVFKGDAKRAVNILCEIGLKDSADGKSWSEAWGYLDRIPTVLGNAPDGDIVLRADIVLGVNTHSDLGYNQIYNARNIQRYTERRLGDGDYVVIQDMIRDDSVGAPPRGPRFSKRGPKPYHPVKEWIPITVVHGNGDGTFTLGYFVSAHGQELKPISGTVDFLANLFRVDVEKIMRKDTIKSREKWNSLFQQAVLAPAP
jgi:hypothetical protein